MHERCGKCLCSTGLYILSGITDNSVNIRLLYIFSAEMNQEAGMVRIVAHYKEQEMQSRLAYLLLDAGTSALRSIFDSIHPAVSLRDHLKQAHVRSVLQRLLQQVISSNINVFSKNNICNEDY